MRPQRLTYLALLAVVSLSFSGCGDNDAPPSIVTHPLGQMASTGETVTFTVVVAGSGPFHYQWKRNQAELAGATSASYRTPPLTKVDDGAQFQVVVSNSKKSVVSNPATLSVTNDVLTYHNDNARTGQNLSEMTLTPANVNSTLFGKIGFYSVDGKVDAQPLHLENIAIPNNGVHDVLYVPTEHDSVYALDANTGAQLWKVSLLLAGETPTDERHCGLVAPEIGITSTPVIDRRQGAIYLIAASKDASGNYFQRLHALDVTTGAELFGGPKTVEATYPGTGDNSSGGNVMFDAGQYLERAALLLLNGAVYTTWASNCDYRPYTAWIIGYDAATLDQKTVLNLTPNGTQGAIWMSGAGPAADNTGNIYLLDGNGTFDTNLDKDSFPIDRNFGNAFLKISTSGGLTVADYFEMNNEQVENDEDHDLGSGGAMVLPDFTDGSGKVLHLAVGAGKDSNMYVIDRDSMGKFDPNSNNIYQELTKQFSSGIFSAPAYFNSAVYFGASYGTIKLFNISNAKLSATPVSQTTNTFGYPGASPSISANGTANAILWAVENGSTAVLHAYDATNLTKELYNSNQASSRDQFGAGNKFITPMIVDGKVFVGTTNGIAVFGLLSQPGD